MAQFEQILKEWLSGKLSDSDYLKKLIEHRSECECRFSRGKFLKLKNFNRLTAREILNELSPCDVCNENLTIEQLFLLAENLHFDLIKKPKYVNSKSLLLRELGEGLYAKCKKCGSIFLFIPPERSFRGWWGKVG